MKLVFKSATICRALLLTIFLLAIYTFGSAQAMFWQTAVNTNPPTAPVKLIFIHHSTGENWLTDGYGDLGLTLAQNNYFVSDTNYGWGPDGIGDRTDIPNWPEWFRSAETPRYMAALFNESDQHADYTRMFADPGGENQIVLFKSCFPNSDLYGSGNDPPTQGYDFTVGNAKWVYNEILQYFATRPDKLFIVITAPPLSSPTIPENARAFNQWLVNDWLRESDYPYNNVAVFDFYNVLTSPDAHHQVVNGVVEHVVGSQDTLYYPSDDDHPSVAGSRKATAEFVPMLNFFYHRWQNDVPTPTTEPTEAAAAPTATMAVAAETAVLPVSLIDDFEVNRGWEAFWDEATPTQITCQPARTLEGSGMAMQIDFNIDINTWATCARFFDVPQAWQDAEGLSFYLQAVPDGMLVDIDLYVGPEDARETYVYTLETPPGSAEHWVPVHLHWADFHRVEWEENGGTPFTMPDRVSGVAFGFGTDLNVTNSGVVWVDDLSLVTGDATALAQTAAALTDGVAGETAVANDALSVTEPATSSTSAGGPCPASMVVLGLALAPLAHKKVVRQRKRRY
ncbi:MAG: hypothetical protein R3E31_11380 [Chloroflexota bacterium]